MKYALRRSEKGSSSHPYYRKWISMLTRCYRETSDNYQRYGGRGIKLCDEWRVFDNFKEWVDKFEEGLSLERIDVNGDYCPENCTMIPLKHQYRNKRDTLFYDFNGRKVRALILSKVLNADDVTFRRRVAKYDLDKTIIYYLNKHREGVKR